MIADVHAEFSVVLQLSILTEYGSTLMLTSLLFVV